jgi:hypothetical protein
MARNEGWPPYKDNGGFRRDPDGRFLTPDGFLKSGRSLAGPLRTGTEPRVGPRAQGPVEAARTAESDFGTDRVSPREFDPMGTSRRRSGDIPSDFITGQLRKPRER